MATIPLCFEFFRCRIDVLQSEFSRSTISIAVFCLQNLIWLLHYFAIIVFNMKTSSFSVIQKKQTRPRFFAAANLPPPPRNHVTLLLSHQSETGTRTWGTQAGRNVTCEKAPIWGSCEKSRESSRSLARALARSRFSIIRILNVEFNASTWNF